MLLKGAFVLKSAESGIERLDVRIGGGLIKDTGILEPLEGEEVFDLSGKLIMPAFYNAHTHAAMTLMRGISDDDPFDVWLFKKVLPLEERLDGEMVYYGTMVALMEMASKGVAGFVDMYFFLDDVAKAAEDMGMRALITRGLVDENGEDGGRLEENLDFARRWKGSELIEPGLGPHAPYTCSLDYLKRIAEAARDTGLPVTIHLYEAAWERERYDFRDILSVFEGIHLIIAHAVQFTEEEIKELTREELYVAHNPSSNLKLGNGVAKVSRMIEKGVKVSLGTDGAASNNSLDVWHEMRLAALLQKMEDPTKLGVEDALRMATEMGAEAMGINGGRIEPGRVADLVVVDIKKFHYMPPENLKSHIVHSGSSGDVFATMVNGKWIYFDGEFPNVDVDEILEGFKRSVERLYNRS